MEIKKKYLNWVDKNIEHIDNNKTVLVIGATGSIGTYLVNYLAYKGAKIILAGRNKQSVLRLKHDLIKQYNANVEGFVIDFASLQSVNTALRYIKSYIKCDVIINNAGIYHQPKKEVEGFDQTYLVNYLMPVYFYEKLFEEPKFRKCRIINVASISYNYHELDLYDFTGEERKSKTARYSVTKRNLMYYTTYLRKERNIDAILVHPGVSTTNLFSEKNGAYNKFFYKVCVPIMKCLFMPPVQAALSLLKAIDVQEIKENEWVGPRGLFHSWGYPNIQKIKGDITDSYTLHQVMLRTSRDLGKLNK